MPAPLRNQGRKRGERRRIFGCQEAVGVVLDDLEVQPPRQGGHGLPPGRWHGGGRRVLQRRHAIQRRDPSPRRQAQQGARTQPVFVHRHRQKLQPKRRRAGAEAGPGQRLGRDGVARLGHGQQRHGDRVLRSGADQHARRVVRQVPGAGQPLRPGGAVRRAPGMRLVVEEAVAPAPQHGVGRLFETLRQPWQRHHIAGEVDHLRCAGLQLEGAGIDMARRPHEAAAPGFPDHQAAGRQQPHGVRGGVQRHPMPVRQVAVRRQPRARGELPVPDGGLQPGGDGRRGDAQAASCL